MRKKLPCLDQRGETYYFRIVVPAPLRRILGRKEIRRSLENPDLNSAAAMVMFLRGKYKSLFLDLQMGKITDEQIAALAEQDFAINLYNDELARLRGGPRTDDQVRRELSFLYELLAIFRAKLVANDLA